MSQQPPDQYAGQQGEQDRGHEHAFLHGANRGEGLLGGQLGDHQPARYWYPLGCCQLFDAERTGGDTVTIEAVQVAVEHRVAAGDRERLQCAGLVRAGNKQPMLRIDQQIVAALAIAVADDDVEEIG